MSSQIYKREFATLIFCLRHRCTKISSSFHSEKLTAIYRIRSVAPRSVQIDFSELKKLRQPTIFSSKNQFGRAGENAWHFSFSDPANRLMPVMFFYPTKWGKIASAKFFLADKSERSETKISSKYSQKKLNITSEFNEV